MAITALVASSPAYRIPAPLNNYMISLPHAEGCGNFRSESGRPSQPRPIDEPIKSAAMMAPEWGANRSAKPVFNVVLNKASQTRQHGIAARHLHISDSGGCLDQHLRPGIGRKQCANAVRPTEFGQLGEFGHPSEFDSQTQFHRNRHIRRLQSADLALARQCNACRDRRHQ